MYVVITRVEGLESIRATARTSTTFSKLTVNPGQSHAQDLGLKFSMLTENSDSLPWDRLRENVLGTGQDSADDASEVNTLRKLDAPCLVRTKPRQVVAWRLS